MRRAKLALLRVLYGLLLGMLAGAVGGAMCLVSPAVFVAAYAASVYLKLWGLEGKENYTAGIVSAPAALLLGYFIGSVI